MNMEYLRSNPGTPTQPRRPDFIGVNHPNQVQVNMNMVHHQQSNQQLPNQQQLLYSQTMVKPHEHQIPGIHMNRQQQQSMQNHVYGSPQRRFLSEGELVRQGAELSYARSNNTVDNIRELASSPQHGVYMWKDNSPGYNGNQPSSQFPGAQNQLSNPNTHHEYMNPTQQSMQQQTQHYIPNRGLQNTTSAGNYLNIVLATALTNNVLEFIFLIFYSMQ